MPLLVEGDEMKCQKCHNWHVLHRASVLGPYPQPMLYITCRAAGGELYAGNAGNKTDREVRSPAR